MKHLPKLIAAIVACEAVGIVGSFFTVSAIPTWYATLQKPWFAPPNWIFAPVWTILYILMGLSVYLIWIQGLHKKRVKNAIFYFLIQLTLNFIWSPIFFGLQSPLLALLVIIAMWSTIVLTISTFYPLSKLAAYLLVPYVLWVSFASLLNAAIVVLN